MAKIDIKADMREARKYLKEIGERGIASAGARTINKSLPPAKTQASKSIRERRALPAAEVKKSITVSRASNRRLTGTLFVNGGPIPMHRYKTRQLKRGIKVTVTPGKATVFKSAFQPKGKGSPMFQRVGKPRLPIEKLMGPSIPSAFRQQVVINEVRASVNHRWRRLFDHELAREIEKARRKARR